MKSRIKAVLRFCMFFLVLSSLVTWTTSSTGSAVYASGRLIQATPFDHKLATAGVFDEIFRSANGSASRNATAEELFWTAKSYRYAPDAQGDHWQTSEETEARRAGDCEDKAVWLYAQLRHSGYSDVRLVIGKYRNVDKQYHVWVTYSDDDGNMVILDPTIQKRPWKMGDFTVGFYKPMYSFDGQSRYRYL